MVGASVYISTSLDPSQQRKIFGSNPIRDINFVYIEQRLSNKGFRTKAVEQMLSNKSCQTKAVEQRLSS
jgi:hypothetical protein